MEHVKINILVQLHLNRSNFKHNKQKNLLAHHFVRPFFFKFCKLKFSLKGFWTLHIRSTNELFLFSLTASHFT
jgi:hypothetical protein